MRSIFVGVIALAASMAAAHPAQAQERAQRPPMHGELQARTGHREPKNYDLPMIQKDRETIQKDNHDLELPASRDDPVGAGQIQSEEEAQTKRIDRDSARIDREIRNICPSC
jgi:hypothetical protein